MSVGPLGGLAASVAGSPLAQTKGSEPERAEQDAGALQRRTESDRKAEAAAGIGQTDGEDHETAERDADGRRLWERSPETQDAEPAEEPTAGHDPPQSKDSTGQSGNRLDLSG